MSARRPPREKVRATSAGTPVRTSATTRDSFWQYEDLPRPAQRQWRDYRKDGGTFIRLRLGERDDFMPVADFQLLPSQKSTGGRGAQGAFAEGFGAAVFVRLLEPAEARRSGFDYAAWRESW